MSNVPPIPEGFHTVSVHMCIKNCTEAIEFYKKAFGAEELCRMPGPGGAIMHAELKIGDSIIMVAEEWPGEGMPGSPATLNGTSVTISLYVEDAAAAQKKAVEAGATMTMPVAEMFWGDLYGRVVDPYGHHWSFATHVKDMTPEEISAAGIAAMEQMGDCKPD